ncbi:hypothetical protein ACFV9E_06520 [Streptomyces sp. NPDC059835]|uniref:hypothetical protein n=1 Tax=Streptomyces sp. NPDC059835 TaxID=3346967 RepID=UPI0036599D5E
MSSPPTVEELPPLQEGRLYKAEETSQYVPMSPNWLKRAAGADKIQHTRVGRFIFWNAQNIRDISAGVPHQPSHGSTRRPAASKPRTRRPSSNLAAA